MHAQRIQPSFQQGDTLVSQLRAEEMVLPRVVADGATPPSPTWVGVSQLNVTPQIQCLALLPCPAMSAAADTCVATP